MSNDFKNYKALQKPLIFIGNPRSGTSVISEIIMRHRKIGFPSQWQDHFPDILHLNYFRLLLDNKYWRVHGQKQQLNKVHFLNKIVFRTGENYEMWSHISGKNVDFPRGFLIDTKASPDSIRFMRAYFNKIVRKQGKARLAFKITGPAKIEYLHSVFPDAQFIRIHRKPIPTVSSLLKSAFWETLGANQLWWTGAYTQEEKDWAEERKNDPVTMTAFQIKRVADVTDYEIQKTKADVFDVHYGDFIKNPEETIQSILEYTGLSIDEACFSYFKKNKIYNRNRKDDDYFGTEDLNKIYSIYSKKSEHF